MQPYSGMPFLNCGKICKVHLPNMLSSNDPPINLAEVKVNIRNIKKPCVLINYSQILAFKIFDFNPVLSITYRLVRRSKHTRKIKVLEEWIFRASEVFPTQIQAINTIEPLVLNFCDCLDKMREESFTYILQITEIESNNATFKIKNQEISAIVSSGESE